MITIHRGQSAALQTVIAQAERARSYAAQVNAPLCTFVVKRQNPKRRRCGLICSLCLEHSINLNSGILSTALCLFFA